MASDKWEMTVRILVRVKRGLPQSLCGLGLLLITACTDADQYFARDDRINPKVGDAVRFNKAAQTLDPWSDESFLSRTESNGKRISKGIKNYEAGKAK